VERLVAGATAGDDAHLAINWGVEAEDNFVIMVNLNQVRMRQFEADKGVLDDIVNGVDDFLHVPSLARPQALA